MSRFFIAGGVIAVLIAVWAWFSDSSPPPYSSEAPLVLSSINGEFFYVDLGEVAAHGSSTMMVLRFEGPGEFVPHHFSDEGMERPMNALQWAEHLGASVVFNAGQYDEGHRHLGLLKGGGRRLSSLERPAWKGLLATGLKGEGVWGRILDLQHFDQAFAEGYRNVIQSMMLMDDREGVRVRRSSKTACRAVVAEDQRGRLLLLFTEGATTLGALGNFLMESELNIVRAMNLDGGHEAQLVIRTPEFSLNHFGKYSTGSNVTTQGIYRQVIPAVIVWRKGEGGETESGGLKVPQELP